MLKLPDYFGSKSSSPGFTMIEMIVAVAVAGIISAAVAATTYQTIAVNALSSNHLVAVKQVENAIYTISRDAEMSDELQSSHPDGSYNFSSALIISWKDWTGAIYSASYTLSGSSMQRTYSLNGTTQSVQTVARYIDSTASGYQFSGGTLQVTISSHVGGFKPATEVRTCKIVPTLIK